MYRYIRLTQLRLSDCCPGTAAIVLDSEKNICYCSNCWGKKLHLEHPDFIIKTNKHLKDG